MVERSRFKPYVSASESPAEFTARGIVPGILFGIVFGAANAYLGLRAGLTISTSIPIAVMTVAAFKIMQAAGRPGSILEANISQTTGSASSSVASGVIFTIPALFLWGLDPTLLQMTLLAFAGGMLGVLFMIPLRKLLIDREHDRLPYPEGTACAEVLVASEVGGGRAKNVFTGLAVGALFKAMAGGIRLFPSHVEAAVPFLRKGQIGGEVSAALFGVGYILGPYVASVMVSGGLLASLVIIPIIATWGENRTVPFYPETELTIAEMSASQIWSRYVRYIGAGAVAAAGIMTLVRSIPTMMESFKVGVSHMRGSAADAPAVERTSLDLPYKVSLIGAGAVVVLLAVFPQAFGSIQDFTHRAIAALCVAVFAFFFVTVSSRIVGLVGVTSNPTSGMTIAALLGTSAVFLFLGWTDNAGKMAALTVGTVVAIAASIAGDMSQDLKTGFLLGATPRRQQLSEMIGVLSSATFVCLAVLLLDRAYGFGTRELPAPQATLMRLVIDGVLENVLPWTLVGIGVAIAIVASLFRIPVLPFAVGVYLPVATMVPIFLGGMLRLIAERRSRSDEERASRREQGILLGSGLVGGEGLVGVAIAGVAFYLGRVPAGIGFAWAGAAAQWVAAAAFALLVFWFWRSATARSRPEPAR
ncbi:MAG TPA: oligopeptide transporter, OPT family [Thermoanaerobaculia bacterium]|nr:oligopeptide transporter, OPT family [Thermoanaerobaculia bacterium]